MSSKLERTLEAEKGLTELTRVRLEIVLGLLEEDEKLFEILKIYMS